MNISNLIDSIVNLIDRFQQVKQNAKKELAIEINRIKKKIMITIFQSFFYCTALALIIASIIIFFANFLALEIVFLGMGLILLYVATLLKYY